MKKLLIAALIGLLAMSAFAQTIEVGGSTSVAPLMEQLVSAYTSSNPNVRVNINATGSGDGINNAGTVYQLGMSSRDLTPAEKGRGYTERVIAIDGIAVIVHRNNPVSNLTLEQIRDIYSGAITDWSQVTGGRKQGRIAVISRESGSGTRGAFEEIVGLCSLVAGATENTSTGAIKASITQNQDAIGYISLGSVDRTIKAVNVEGVAASARNVANRSYRLARPFILLHTATLTPASRAFLDWILSRAGQTIVRNAGYVPI